MQTNLRGRDMITTQEWTLDELETVFDVAWDLKRRRALGEPHALLRDKVLAMLFFFSSTRTRASFEAGMAQLGGHAQFIDSETTQISHGDTAKEIGEILGRYNDGIAIRQCDWNFGNKYIREVAAASRVPVLNMQLLMTRLGMNVTLTHPPEYKLMPEIVGQAQDNAKKSGGSFAITNTFDDGFKDADIVYPKSWGALLTTTDNAESARIGKKYTDWICDTKRMKMAKEHAIYMHCLPADRNIEVADEVIDGPQSVVYDEAENRLHVQKAVMALTMR